MVLAVTICIRQRRCNNKLPVSLKTLIDDVVCQIDYSRHRESIFLKRECVRRDDIDKELRKKLHVLDQCDADVRVVAVDKLTGCLDARMSSVVKTYHKFPDLEE